MNQIKILNLSKKRFDALTSFSIRPAASNMGRELAWYTNEDESIIGTILQDSFDHDFAAILLGRDEGSRYRAFDYQVSFADEKFAEEWLINTMKWKTGQGQKVFPQGDSTKGLDLFTPIVPEEKLHPYFSHLRNGIAFTPARELIKEMMPHYTDIDGNFVEQFQTSGFDSRLWELCIFAYLNEEKFVFHRNYNAPDFIVQNGEKIVAIEAVIVGRKNNPPCFFKTEHKQKPFTEILQELENEMPIRFGSPLFSKLQKEYWQLPHVSGNPLVLAIADFHADQSMLWSSTSLITYLYGINQDYHLDENNQLVINSIEIEKHKVGEKEIPSGFFFQPNVENISGVLFSASGTISKFNRIGRQSGFKVDNHLMRRHGTFHDHDPNAVKPKPFSYIVDENSSETWGEGFALFHNPNAICPVSENLFPSIGHHYFRDGQIESHLPKFYTYGSITQNIVLTS
jgi:hypothetical protein